ncbi:MAG TPA: hypothetical protein PKN99_13245 [Cyclobacteriaceae bacterium]|jgi:hypothetical protein|nr:hypothetical protein [Cyclobacteriaceae bacterium]
MRKEYLDETEAYVNESERLKVAWELLSYANLLYSRVYVFRNYEAFAQSFNIDPPPEEYWEGLSREKLIDEIKICTAFENYNKSVLLSKGYVVHLIDSQKNRALADQQKTTPVLISDFLKSNRFIQKDRFSELYLEGFQNFNTISFSRTLTEQYQAIIGLDGQFLNYLKNLNKKRNRLHYLKNYAGAFRIQTYLDTIAFAKSYGTELLLSEIKKVEEHLRKFD